MKLTHTYTKQKHPDSDFWLFLLAITIITMLLAGGSLVEYYL